MQDIIQALRKHLQGEVRFDLTSRILYSTDASIYELMPLGVVIPKSAEDIQATIEIAHQHGVAIVPRGAGTSIVGNAIGEGIVLDCSKYLNHILEVNREENWVRIQPGVVLDQLNQHLKTFGLLFGPDVATSSRASLGGLIGNNSSGAHSIVYGKTLDHVLELKVLLSNGETAKFTSQTHAEWQNKLNKPGFVNSLYSRVDAIVLENQDEIERRFPKILRRVAGYNLDEFVQKTHHNLAKLLVGSEGTLAVVTEAKLNLVPLPKHSVLAVVHFHDLFSALDAVSPIIDFQPSAIELLDDNIIDLTRSTMECSRRLTFVDGFPAALLLVEFQGDSKTALIEKLNRLADFLSKNKLGYQCFKAVENAQQADVWYVRKAGLGLLMGTRADRKPIGFIEDSAVAPEKLPQYIKRFDEIVRSFGTEAAYYAHASVGCLHIRPKLNLKDAHDVEIMAKMAAAISSLALEFGGTISGEHGDGLAHSCWNEKMFGSRLYQAFREIKKAFDPKNILNPGKIVDAQFLTKNFRKPPNPEIQTIQPFFDYSREGGLNTAIAMCNGNGFCRKLTEGAMCPSYMVTLEEAHSTRGRANALRAVLTGKVEPSEFTSRKMYEIMELCVSCKGCKGECPTNVDMAKLKTEFLYHYHKTHGLPLQDKLFGNIATLSRWGSRLAPMSNWLLHSLPVRWLLQQAIGIECRRALPTFAREPFHRWFEKRPVRTQANKVVLFNDTFLNFNYPQIGRAAVIVLEAAGWEVILPEKKCCGRPFISRGMLQEARKHVEYNIDALYPLIEQGYQLVGFEPSCVSTFREEYPDLLKDSRVTDVAENTLLFDEFLLTVLANPASDLNFKRAEKKYLLHTHCHQNALIGSHLTRQLLQVIPDLQVEAVDAGCCGMAGAFGYEREHYQFSLAMGRRKLFPAVEAKDDSWQMLATGVSCRQQIEHATGKSVKHPVEVLAKHLP